MTIAIAVKCLIVKSQVSFNDLIIKQFLVYILLIYVLFLINF